MIKWLGITIAVIIIIPTGIYFFTSLNQVDTFDKDSIKKPVKEEVVIDTAKSFQEGLDAYNAGNIDLSAEKFDEVLKGDSNKKAEANYYMGLIYKSRNLDESAKSSFQKAINIKPEYLEPKKELMKIALTENDYNTAFELFNSLIDKNVLSKLETVEAYNSFVEQGLCYESDEGVKLSQKILNLDKNNKHALGILLNYYKDTDQKKYAEYLDRYIRNVEYSRYGAMELYNIYYNSQYYTKALGVLDLLEQHGYNSYEIEQAREHVKQKRDEYRTAE